MEKIFNKIIQMGVLSLCFTGFVACSDIKVLGDKDGAIAPATANALKGQLVYSGNKDLCSNLNKSNFLDNYNITNNLISNQINQTAIYNTLLLHNALCYDFVGAMLPYKLKANLQINYNTNFNALINGSFKPKMSVVIEDPNTGINYIFDSDLSLGTSAQISDGLGGIFYISYGFHNVDILFNLDTNSMPWQVEVIVYNKSLDPYSNDAYYFLGDFKIN